MRRSNIIDSSNSFIMERIDSELSWGNQAPCQSESKALGLTIMFGRPGLGCPF